MPAKTEAKEGTAILVIDDERLICDLLRMMLERQGYDVHTASNGQEGIDAFRRLKPTFTFLDLRLPDMSGIEVLKQIRQANPDGAVMILTAAPSEILEKQARELGATDFLIKGLPMDVLIGAVRSATGQPAPSATPAPVLKKEPVGKSIVVIDDDTEIRYWLTQALTDRGHRVRTAANGQAGLDLVEAEPPDLVIMDLVMPGLTGVQVMRRLKARNYSGVTMMLTGSQEDQMLKEALDLGPIDVVAKSADPERILLAIEARLALTKR